jgi:hypothetical protein
MNLPFLSCLVNCERQNTGNVINPDQIMLGFGIAEASKIQTKYSRFGIF